MITDGARKAQNVKAPSSTSLLGTLLKRKGKRPFFSFNTLKNQVDSDDLIWTNLVKSKKMVLICSHRDYAESAWVKSEWKRWIELGRMKGLGEMDPHEMEYTVMSPETRTLKQITMDDGEAAARVFLSLMGESVDPRKKFI